ncbi:MAG TPA: S-layer homology domain-containing protein [Leptolyngbya sp.]|jgi:hypothetical protein|nr:S-layer homology domain-containing protein [Leptolyngbya sp.]
MPHPLQKLCLGGAVLGGLGAGAIAALVVPLSNPAIAASNTAFPDTQNYWAQPFIQSLAQKNIISGYPDGTYRPKQSVDRDEFASIVRDAFNQKQERQISSGSAYKDIPQGYWAASAIESAYQMGFMSGYPGGYFRPRQPVTKVEAISSLARNLNLQGASQAPVVAVHSLASQAPIGQAAVQAARPQAQNRRTLMFPMAMTALMQPLVSRPAAAIAAAIPSVKAPQKAQPMNTANAKPAEKSAIALLSEYYTDANKIPKYAVNDVAAATKAGIIVNYPNLKVLNPNQPATRGEIAALVHQALVSQGRAQPIANEAAKQYVVSR